MSKKIHSEPIKTLSLFSGAGGLDIGFHNAGYHIVACVEIEEAYCRTLSANSGKRNFFGYDLTVHNTDIRTFDPSHYTNQQIDCVIGGPPCQTFSAAGRRSGGVIGTTDYRGRLFESYCRILDIIRPKVFVFENVYGLPGANNGGPWREICSAFSAIGYELHTEVIDSADYGVPQHRERLIIVGVQSGAEEFHFPLPTHGPDSLSGLPLQTVSDAIQDLQSEDETSHKFDGLYGHLLSLVPEGLNYSFFTREMGYPKPYFAWRSKFHDFLYKADPNTPARTLKAQPGKFTGPFHWKNRHFSVQELKRLQTFPDGYEIVGNYSKVVEQIGNSVPPLLAEVIAISVREQILRPVEHLKFKSRSWHFKSTFRQRQRERTKHFKEVARLEIEKRFPDEKIDLPETVNKTKGYYLGYKGFFDKQYLEGVALFNPEKKYLKVAESRAGDQIDLEITPHDSKRADKLMEIKISGLSKYLIEIDKLNCKAQIGQVLDYFMLWDIIQHSLVSESQFFSLIDIYGHYANRGDTVRIQTKITGTDLDSVDNAIEYFGDSKHCGIFMDENNFYRAINTSESLGDATIKKLRTLRWDVRTSITHSTIRNNVVLCTYPFPLLSEKAHLERKVNLIV